MDTQTQNKAAFLETMEKMPWVVSDSLQPSGSILPMYALKLLDKEALKTSYNSYHIPVIRVVKKTKGIYLDLTFYIPKKALKTTEAKFLEATKSMMSLKNNEFWKSRIIFE